MDPICAAALATFETQAQRFGAVIAGLRDEALNWRPGPETNSLAVLVVHTWNSARMWTARAGGQEVARDRAAEFRAVATGAELRAVLDGAIGEVRACVAALDPATFGQEVAGRLDGDVDGERVTRARCLIHALEHTQEHLGQAFLTRQLWEQRHGEVMAEDTSGYRLPASRAD